jgi:hypothetical protein
MTLISFELIPRPASSREELKALNDAARRWHCPRQGWRPEAEPCCGRTGCSRRSCCTASLAPTIANVTWSTLCEMGCRAIWLPISAFRAGPEPN